MKAKWVSILITIILVLSGLYYVVFQAPYCLQDKWKENSLGVVNMKSFTEIDELANYFKGDTIKKVTYIGSNTYEVTTNKGDYIIVANYKGSVFWKYKIFNYDKEVKYFTNPM